MPLKTIRSGVTNHPEKSVLQFQTDLVRQGGAISGFNATEKTGGVDMSVDVHAGTLYARNYLTAYPVSLDTTEKVLVSLNSNANPLIGVVVAYIDLGQIPNPDGEGEGIAKFMYIAGLPAVSPIPPSDDDVQSVLGAGTPYERICHVLVGSQVTAIVNEDITDARRRAFVKAPRPAILQSTNETINIDVEQGNDFIFTLTGDVTVLEPVNMLAGDVVSIAFIQDETGDRLVSWFAGLNVVGDILELATEPDQITQYVLKKVGEGKYYLFLAGKME